MDINEVRETLLAQHRAIRKLIYVARRTASRVGRGEATATELERALERLRECMLAHCLEEDALLRPILADVDAWGPVRLALMSEEHEAEHELLLDGIDRASALRDPEELDAALKDLSGQLLEHMATEERHLLDAGVLTDELVRSGQMVG